MAASWVALAIGWVACLLNPAQAANRVELDSLRWQLLSLQGLSIERIDAPEAAQMRWRLQRLEVAGVEWQSIEWLCRIDPQPDARACDGPLRLAGRAQGRLELSLAPVPGLRWQAASASLSVRAADWKADPINLQLKSLPLARLQPLLATLWPEGRLGAGRVDAEGHYSALSGAGDLQLRLAGASVDSADGRIAAAGLDAALTLTLSEQAGRSALQGQLQIDRGELLLGPLYAELAASSKLALRAGLDAAGGWALQHLRWTDNEGLDLALEVETNATSPVAAATPTPTPDWRGSLNIADLALSGPRYLQSLSAWTGLEVERFGGGLRAELAGHGASLHRIDLHVEQLALAAPARGLLLEGAQGRLGWQAEGHGASSAVDWTALSVADVAMGAGQLQLHSESGSLVLDQPLKLQPWSGALTLTALRFDPRAATFSLQADLDALDLAAMSRQLGWPLLEGRLQGRLPQLRYADQRLQIDGDLQMGVWGGQIVLGALQVERPFGVAPTLQADLRLQNLELSPLTRSLGFGEISGWLDGEISGLRLVDGAPVAFDARFETDPAFPGKQRISQRAVQDLSSVGGGLAAGLQNQALRLFDEFSYRRIGIRCRLDNNICHMGGLDSSPAGYTVVEGSGLPRITVNGFQRRVDWPVLLSRLRTASSRGVTIE